MENEYDLIIYDSLRKEGYNAIRAEFNYEGRYQVHELLHVPSGITGSFLKYTYPTGKPKTIVIQTHKGEYFAPASEFKYIT